MLDVRRQKTLVALVRPEWFEVPPERFPEKGLRTQPAPDVTQGRRQLHLWKIEMTNTDTRNVVIDAPTIALVDAWAKKSAFMPRRRQAVRGLIRVGLRQVQKPAAAKAPAPAPEQQPGGAA